VRFSNGGATKVFVLEDLTVKVSVAHHLSLFPLDRLHFLLEASEETSASPLLFASASLHSRRTFDARPKGPAGLERSALKFPLVVRRRSKPVPVGEIAYPEAHRQSPQRFSGSRGELCTAARR